ncbi:hypothetical protein JTE90_004175 [Oedothorax gibbosus]|uniref:Zinc finger BED domain-containing protein 1 n=1 Tax=Oedothorax gibbosus TaxID=931172 RepID=A0AAV6TV11_9ARAC|nr:hypothetical protein JTE90_004175 [Oedothorax gibbosus]
MSYSDIQAIDMALVKMIAKDFQPISIVENKGFLEYSKKLNPLYTPPPPNRKKITNEMIPSLYETCRNQLVSKLAAVEYVALTTDVWTSDTNSSFVSITGHYVYNNTLSSSVLETKQLVENHTGANIASAIAEVLENYSISSKVVTVVADNAANMKNAIEEHLKLPYQPCVAHTLNLVAEDGLSVSETLKDIVKKCRSLVGHFKSSTISTAKLQQAQDQLGLIALV